MKHLILIFSAVLMLLLAACTAQPEAEQSVEEGDGPLVTVYHSPT